MSKSEKQIFFIGLLIIACTFISKDLTRNFYLMRLNKLILLTFLPMIYMHYKSNVNFNLHLDKKLTGTLSLFVFSIIILTYIVLKSFITPEAIVEDLINGYHLSHTEILIAGLYTIFINAFSEEYFFRFFLLKNSNKLTDFHSIVSAILFSIYHLSIMGSWFSLPIMALSFLGLFMGGLIFNWVTLKTGSMINSYLIHASADAAIMVIGFKLLGLF